MRLLYTMVKVSIRVISPLQDLRKKKKKEKKFIISNLVDKNLIKYLFIESLFLSLNLFILFSLYSFSSKYDQEFDPRSVDAKSLHPSASPGSNGYWISTLHP